ncbi:MAG: BlaI/MecI/CopY family transcriptional regulator [Gemmataceae bacterium]
MARPASEQPTDGELEILKVLWASGPAELGQVCAAVRRQRPVAATTVATMLKIMLNKGLVQRSPGPRAHLWSAKVSRKSAAAGLIRKLVDRVFDGSAQRLVAHLVEAGELSPNDRREIRRLLESRNPGHRPDEKA